MAKSTKLLKERIYDTEIRPLMAKIIETCQKNDIAFVASFGLTSGGKCCTSFLLEDRCKPQNSYFAARDAILGESFGHIFK